MAGHDDDLDVGIPALEQLQEIETVTIWQDEVHDRHGEVAAVHAAGRFRRATRRFHEVTLALEDEP
jgi:hypothetical protein